VPNFSCGGIGIFCDFSFGIIFQQVTQRMVTHCAGGFWGLGVSEWWAGGALVLFNAQPQYFSRFGWWYF
jgi:hypothetical protein